jgi:LemA protein
MSASILVLVAAAFLIVGLLAYLVVLYNSLVQVRLDVDTAWSNIDVLLKERHDALGKLLESVKGYMNFESSVLTQITQLRTTTGSGAPDPSRLQAESRLSTSLGQFFAVAENYPQLHSSEQFTQLSTAIQTLEDKIAHRREFFNAEVNVNNARTQQFPDMLLAPLAGVRHRDLFAVSAEDEADVDVAAALAPKTT